MKLKLLTTCIAYGLALNSVGVFAGEVDRVFSVSSQYIDQSYTFDVRDDESATTFQVTPRFGLTYVSPRINTNINVSNIHQRFEIQNETRTYNFAEGRIDNSITVFDRLLSVFANYSVDYSAFNTNNLFSNSFLSTDKELDKRSQSNVGTVSELITGDYFGGSLLTNFSDLTIDVGNSEEDLTSKSSSVALQLNDGDAFTWLNWDFTLQNNASDQFNGGEFKSQNANLNVDFGLIGDFGISLSAFDETNEIGNFDNVTEREFSYYGAGINYNPAPGRLLSITVNESSSDIEEDDGEQFVAGRINWEFSSRTQLNASVSKRFFGRTSSANLVYNLKHLRASVSRREAVTSTSQLLSEGLQLTPFVCGAGATTVNDCFLPTNSDYQLGAGETFINFAQPSFIVEDSVIINKTDTLGLLYDKRKTTVNVLLVQNEQQFLNTSETLISDIFEINAGWKVGVFTSVSLRYRLADSEIIAADNSISDASANELEFIIERDIGKNLSVDLSLQQLESEGQIGNFARQFDEDYDETRISLSVNYTTAQ